MSDWKPSHPWSYEEPGEFEEQRISKPYAAGLPQNADGKFDYLEGYRRRRTGHAAIAYEEWSLKQTEWPHTTRYLDRFEAAECLLHQFFV